MNKLLVVIAGPGGGGKSTAVSALKEEHEELGFRDQVNDTTRKRRENEIEKSDYNHIDEQEYIELDRADMYISTRRKTGKNKEGKLENQRYGLQEPEGDKTVFILDGPGIQYLQDYCRKTGDQLFSIFFDVERSIAYKRMLEEGDTQRARTRDKQYDEFMQAKGIADYVIDANRPLECVKKELINILNTQIDQHSVLQKERKKDMLT